jgi:transcriptional regulator of arginine metabolism
MGRRLRDSGRREGASVTSPGSPRTMTARRARISALIATHEVASQEELGHLLAEEGIHVTQATLSRDLDAIGATKAVAADGHLHYALSGASVADTSIPVAGGEANLARVATELLVRAEAAGNIAVLHTPPGAAQFFAGHLDRSAAFDTVGTVAGDDTVIIVMRTPQEADDLCNTLLRMADQRRAP